MIHLICRIGAEFIDHLFQGKKIVIQRDPVVFRIECTDDASDRRDRLVHTGIRSIDLFQCFFLIGGHKKRGGIEGNGCRGKRMTDVVMDIPGDALTLFKTGIILIYLLILRDLFAKRPLLECLHRCRRKSGSQLLGGKGGA